MAPSPAMIVRLAFPLQSFFVSPLYRSGTDFNHKLSEHPLSLIAWVSYLKCRYNLSRIQSGLRWILVVVQTSPRLLIALCASVALSGCAHEGGGLSRFADAGPGRLLGRSPAATVSAATTTPTQTPAESIVASSEEITPVDVAAPATPGARNPELAQAEAPTEAFAEPPAEPPAGAPVLDALDHTAKDVARRLLRHELPSENSLDLPPRNAHVDGRLADVLRHTLADNPDIGIATAQLEDERIAIEVARAGTQPTVNLRVAHGQENYESEGDLFTAVPRSEFGIDLHQTIYDFGRTSYNISRRKALHNSAGYRQLHKLNEIAQDVAGAYLRILEADEQIRIAEANVASHDEIFNLVSAQQQAGNASVADVKRVTTRLEKARTGLIDLRSRRQNAREELSRIAGFAPGSLAPPPRLPPPLPPAGMSSADYPDNPELLSIRADIDSLRAQAEVAKANLAPTIDLDLTGALKDNVSGETGETSNFKGMISLNYKLMDGEARLNTARQVYARVDESKQRYRKKRRDYVEGLENAIRTVRTNAQKSSSLATRVADSGKVLDLYKAQFKDGNRTLFELLDAQLELFTAQSEDIANRYSTMQSIYEIHALRGDLVARLLNEQP